MLRILSNLFDRMRRHPRRALLALALLGVLAWGGTLAGRDLWARHYYAAAQQALAREDLDQAQHDLDLCLKVWDDRPEVHLLAAQTARRRDAYDDADRHLTACERLQGKTEAAALERDLLIAQQGAPDSVIGRLKGVASQRPGQAAAVWEAIAKGYLNCYCKAEALAYAERLLQQSPDHLHGRMWRGRALESLDRAEDAVPDFERAVELAPGWDEARLRLAACLFRVGRPWDARVHYEALRERRPDDPEVLLGLSRCCYDLHDLDGARQSLDRLLDLRPSDVPALLDRGRLEFHAGRTAEAERWLRRASELAPRDREVCLALARCLEAEARETEAQLCRDRLRQILADLQVIHDLIEKSKHTPDDAALRYQIGVRLQERGEEADAASWFFAALGEDPHYVPAHVALANYFEHTGQHFRAAWHRRAASGPRASGRNGDGTPAFKGPVPISSGRS
jgi:tetratricopeptide (TPR) repeat protein